MKILLLTSEPHLDFVYREVKKHLPQSDFSISIRKTPNFGDYDIGISFMYLYKVPAEQVNTRTWINFHPAPLPEYKGRNLCYHAIMNGKKEFGATVHYMDEGFDTGDIIDVWRFDIQPWYTSEDLSRCTLEISKALFIEYLPRVLSGEDFIRKPNTGGAYYQKMPIEDELYLTDWNKNRIRAITYKEFYPKINIGGTVYKVVKVK